MTTSSRPRRRARPAAWLGAAVLAVAIAAPEGARADTQYQLRPSLILGGGYDDNLLFNGTGGDRVGQGGVKIDLKAWDRLYTLKLDAGMYVYGFQERAQIVPLGESTLDARYELGRLDVLSGWARIRGSDDALGLAQLGIMNAEGSVIGYRSYGEYEHAFDARASTATLLTYDGVSFFTPPYTSKSGSAVGVGEEPRYRLTRELTLETTVDERNFVADGLQGVAADVLPGVRYRLSHHLYMDVNAGLSVFHDTGTVPLAVGHGLLEYDVHEWGLRVTASQDLAVPTGRAGVLFMDLVETTGEYTARDWVFRLRGGYYRTLGSPTATAWDPGYGFDGEGYRRVAGFAWVGFSGMRFMQLATPLQQPMARDAIYAQVVLTGDTP